MATSTVPPQNRLQYLRRTISPDRRGKYLCSYSGVLRMFYEGKYGNFSKFVGIFQNRTQKYSNWYSIFV